MLDKNILEAIQEAGASEAGFFLHYSPAQDKYYGCYSNEKGQIGLLTKPYVTEHHCENALERFREGRFFADIKEGEDGFFAEFRSEGGKAIAWSPAFKDKDSAEAAARQVKGEASFREDPPAKEEANTTEVTPPRHTFRLEFYRGKGQGPVRGRIEYSLTQESDAFQGLDMGFIRSFISRRLDQRGLPESVREAETGKLQLLENGQPAKQSLFLKGQPLEAALDMEAPASSAYNVLVYARALGDGREVLVGRKRGAGGPLTVQVLTQGLTSGLYRFTATLHLEKDGTEEPRSFASPLYQVFVESVAEVVA